MPSTFTSTCFEIIEHNFANPRSYDLEYTGDGEVNADEFIRMMKRTAYGY